MKPKGQAKNNEQYERFKEATAKVLAVSYDEIKRREVEYQEEAAKKPNRRGRKRKAS